MADVTPITQFSAIENDTVDEAVVETLENLLHRARQGKLKALAYAIVNNDRSIGRGWVGSFGCRHPMSSAIMILQHAYAAALPEEGE